MSVQSKPPQTPLLYCKTGVNRGIPIFLIFAPKQIMGIENFQFLKLKKSLCIAWSSFHNNTHSYQLADYRSRLCSILLALLPDFVVRQLSARMCILV